ncbi:MAG: hypothetical protein ACRD1T_10495 [Acidimicrobiia bacterium]
MSKSVLRLMALFAAALLILSACNRGEEKKTATGDKKSSSPGASVEPAGGTPSPTAGAAGAGGQTAAPPAPPKQQASPLAAAALKPIAPGNYVYDETGNRKLGGCGTDGPPPTPTSLKVEPANGSVQRTIREQTSSQGGDVTTTDFEFRTDGIYLIYFHQEMRSPLGSRTNEFKPDPPALVFPTKPTVGKSWDYNFSSSDGNAKFDIKITIEALDQPVKIGDGREVKAVKMLRETHATGSSPQFGNFDFTDKTQSFLNTDTRLIVKEISDAAGTAGTCKIETHREAVIRSTNPA